MVAVLAVAACGLTAFLENADWGDGSEDRLTALEAAALAATALAVIGAASWLTGRLRR